MLKEEGDPERSTALMIAARYGHNKVAFMLIAAGATVDHQEVRAHELPNRKFGVVFQFQFDHILIFLFLSFLPLANVKFGMTALMWASKYGHTAAVQVLLTAKADVNLKQVIGTLTVCR